MVIFWIVVPIVIVLCTIIPSLGYYHRKRILNRRILHPFSYRQSNLSPCDQNMANASAAMANGRISTANGSLGMANGSGYGNGSGSFGFGNGSVLMSSLTP